MIELISLQFGNIRSFVEDQSISFSNREKLIQVDGKNENTGGSSGAGKSTVLMALDYLLGMSEIPSTVLQSRLTKDGIWASGEFVIDGSPVTISRSKKDGLTIKTANETVSGNVKLAEEKLDELIGLPKKIFKKMVHKKQKEGGFFLNMTPKETYEFLIAVLGLEKYVQNIDTINVDIETLLKDISALESNVQLGSASFQDLERILSEKVKPEGEDLSAEIEPINIRINTLRTVIAVLKDESQEMIKRIPKPVAAEADTSEFNAKIAALVPARAEIKNTIDRLVLSKEQLQATLNKIPWFMQEAKRAGETISNLKKNKAHIEEAQCPTCMQTWVGDSAQEQIKAIDEKIKKEIDYALMMKKSLDENPKADVEEKLARIAQIIESQNAMLAQLQEQRAALDAQKFSLMSEVYSKNTVLKIDYDLQVSMVEANTRQILDIKNEALKQAEIELSSKESKRNSYLSSLAAYEREKASLLLVIEKKRSEINAANQALSEKKKLVTIAEESKRLVKTYVLQTFQETLDAIGEATTQILASIPNMATSTVYFEGCKETKSGSIKDEIVAIINSDGNNDIPIKSLSGGERTAIDLAVDLAVIDVIETKVSKGANFFFMDEPFDGLDAVCKENCLEILKQIDTNKKIIMVDHSSELKEMVSDVILIVKKGETSTVSA